jgi:hypothetical protein
VLFVVMRACGFSITVGYHRLFRIYFQALGRAAFDADFERALLRTSLSSGLRTPQSPQAR